MKPPGYGLLQKRSVHKWDRLACQSALLYVADNANDLPRAVLLRGVRLVAQPYLLADRIYVGEIAAHKCLIDYNRPRCGAVIVLVEKAAFLQRDSECTEDVRADLSTTRVGPLVARRYGTAQNYERWPFHEVSRQAGDRPGRFDSRQD
jgi:hypothetical protein